MGVAKVASGIKTTCEVKNCGCTQPARTSGGASFQDVRYGKGMRVHNVTKSSSKTTQVCTCCGKNS